MASRPACGTRGRRGLWAMGSRLWAYQRDEKRALERVFSAKTSMTTVVERKWCSLLTGFTSLPRCLGVCDSRAVDRGVFTFLSVQEVANRIRIKIFLAND